MSAGPTRREALAGAAAASLLAGAARARRIGGVRRLDPRLDAVIGPDARGEVLSEGHRWTEGPLWVPRDGGYLLFTDVPGNVMWRWSPGRGARPFLRPSGLAGPVPATIREPGANGLALDLEGRLLIADSGNRVLARFDFGTRRRTVLANRFGGKRFNSPNDIAVARSGAVYFTDPPYGLKDGLSSPLRELGHQGVYRLDPGGRLGLIEESLSFPNGIALSPDERTLYVSISDPERPEMLAYPLDLRGMRAGAPRLFHDARPHMGPDAPGLPDGMAVDRRGRLFATGPGGVHVLAPDGGLLGIVRAGKAVSNCAIGEDGRSLFLTATDLVLRFPLRGG